VSDTNNQHDENPVVDFIDNSVVANANAPQILVSGELFRARRTRVCLKLYECAQDALARQRIERTSAGTPNQITPSPLSDSSFAASRPSSSR
jgi:hypothetical protein